MRGQGLVFTNVNKVKVNNVTFDGVISDEYTLDNVKEMCE
jgi:hypothetical protein